MAYPEPHAGPFIFVGPLWYRLRVQRHLEAAMSFDLKELNRRGAIAFTAAIATSVLAGSRGMVVAARASDKANPAGDDEISATEDLMREHGVLRRALIVYGELASRLQAGRRD